MNHKLFCVCILLWPQHHNHNRQFSTLERTGVKEPRYAMFRWKDRWETYIFFGQRQKVGHKITGGCQKVRGIKKTWWFKTSWLDVVYIFQAWIPSFCECWSTETFTIPFFKTSLIKEEGAAQSDGHREDGVGGKLCVVVNFDGAAGWTSDNVNKISGKVRKFLFEKVLLAILWMICQKMYVVTVCFQGPPRTFSEFRGWYDDLFFPVSSKNQRTCSWLEPGHKPTMLYGQKSRLKQCHKIVFVCIPYRN